MSARSMFKWLGFAALVIVGFALGRVTRSPHVESHSADAVGAAATPTTWYCSMHPHITLPHPGKCSICGMDLVPVVTEGSTEPRTLVMSEGAMKLAEVETATVTRENVSVDVRLVGKVEFDETEVRVISAWVPGRLDRLYVNYTGVPVAKGDHLAKIYSPKLYEAQQQLFEALESVESSSGESERLRASSLGTLEAVRKRLVLLGLSEEQIAAIEARRTLEDHVDLRSTEAGVVIEKLASEGDYVDTGTPLYRVVSLDRLWVKLDAYESDLAWLRYGQEVRFEVAAYPGRSFAGFVSFIDWIVDERSRTAKVRLNVDNADGRLKPGMFVRARARSTLASGGRVMAPALAGKWISPMHPEIVKDAPGSCDICGMALVPAEELFQAVDDTEDAPLVIPASAPLITGRRAVVYVKAPGDVVAFRGRDVVLGPRAGDHYVVASGLEEGEEVVVRGAFKIDSALQIRAEPSMMQPETSTAVEPPARLTVDAPFLEAFGGALSRAIPVTEAFVASDGARAAEAAKTLREAVVAVPVEGLAADVRTVWDARSAAITTALDRLVSATDLAEGRRAFADLSAALLDADRTFGHAVATFYEIHCPMAFGDEGASWIDAAPEVRNPYVPETMMRCGTVRGPLAPVVESEPEGGGPLDE